MRVPEDVIPCSVLAEAQGYPHGYAAAERVLNRSGWRYFIQFDAWFAPHIANYPTPQLAVPAIRDAERRLNVTPRLKPLHAFVGDIMALPRNTNS
jgi:hypothetical protein